MSELTYLIWTADPDIFSGFITIKAYGLLFAMGFLISQQILVRMLKTEAPKGEKFQKQAEKDVESMTIYMVVATIVGARLGHVLFYEPDKYLSDPISIFKIWEGGLASHGAAVAILIAFWLFARNHKNWTYLQVADRIVIVVALTGCLIRFGNFMNSEIYGLPTNSSYGVVFGRFATDALTSKTSPIEDIDLDKHEKVADGPHVPITMKLHFKNGIEAQQIQSYIENNIPNILGGRYSYISDHITYDATKPLAYSIANSSGEVQVLGIPRHPTQLYESLTSLLLFFLLMAIWFKYKENLPHGRVFGLFLTILFSLRFIHEFFKENQVSFEDGLALNMGQILSIPLVITGIVIFVRSFKYTGIKES
jgi:prolipoprotein diacylglyceryl transferase